MFDTINTRLTRLLQGEEIYEIPAYQRSYSWGKEEIESLWNDMLESYEKNISDPKDYFLGFLILTEENLVIDGQQRLTTMLLIFEVIRSYFYDNINNITNINADIHYLEQYLYESSLDRYSRIRIKKYTNDYDLKKSFGDSFDECLNRPKKNISNYLYLNAKFIIAHLISQMNDIHKLRLFVEYIRKYISVLVIRCKDADIGIDIFYTVNGTGKNLSTSDIIKSKLMLELKDKDRVSFDQKFQEINNFIKSIGYSSMDEFFSLFILVKTHEERNKQLKSKFNEYISGSTDNIKRDGQQMELEINEIYEILKDLETETCKYIYVMKLLGQKNYWRSILITLKLQFKNDDTSFNLLKKILHNYMVKSAICEYTVDNMRSKTSSLLRVIKNENNLEKIMIAMKDIFNGKKVDEDFNRCSNEDADRWAKMALLMLHYNGDTSTSRYSNNLLHLDHIYADKSSDWDNFDEDHKESKLNCIGNLTLLPAIYNIIASNIKFIDKIKFYECTFDKEKYKKLSGDKHAFSETINIKKYNQNNLFNLDQRHFDIIEKIKNILNNNK